MEENNNINIEEQWLDVPGYEGLYRVSSQGRVMSCVFSYLGHCRILRQCKTQGGYPTVRLTKNHQPKTLFVHRLVAQAFIHNPDPDTKIQVNHKDHCRHNNNCDNLEWVTAAEQMDAITRANMSKVRKGVEHKYLRKPVRCVQTGVVYQSLTDCAQKNGYKTRDYISKCCKGLRDTAYGFHWEFVS